MNFTYILTIIVLGLLIALTIKLTSKIIYAGVLVCAVLVVAYFLLSNYHGINLGVENIVEWAINFVIINFNKAMEALKDALTQLVERSI